MNRASVLAVCLGAIAAVGAAAPAKPWQELPAVGWQGERREVAGLKGPQWLAIGYPAKQTADLKFKGAEALPPGLYQLRLALRPSHSANAIAFNGGLEVKVDDRPLSDLEGIHFARSNQPEERTLTFVHSGGDALSLALSAHVDRKTFELSEAQATRPVAPRDPAEARGGDEDVLGDLTAAIAPAKCYYFVLDRAEIRPLSRSACVSAVETDKIRYEPGETLRGTATLRRIGPAPAKGTVEVFLEHDVNVREPVGKFPVEMKGAEEKVPFEVKLPLRELGYAVVAAWRSDDGADSCERAEYFTVADNFYRVALFAAGMGTQGISTSTEAQIREAARAQRAAYGNAGECFAWAEEDMVGMSPAGDYWFSGQTCYHMSKKGLQQVIRVAHENGIAMTTYGKFVMSGYLGWKTAYDYPADHRGQYAFPVGMWEGVNTITLDRFFNKEFAIYSRGPAVRGDRPFKVFWQDFLPINPDPTPRMTRVAAEEVVRSIEMFGWDGIRWDGQMRGGGQCGGQGQYDYLGARQTQTLVRYFKDIVNAKVPRFRHGYNYLFAQDAPGYDWAIEDFELDELSRGGGLLMNESIRNSTGKTYGWIGRNIQVEGDLARERGAYLLGISDAKTPRDKLVESILYFAGGCRPMGGTSANAAINRYGTRYARYTFDETLRRLARPEEVLKPSAETRLWWQSFVYETQRDGAAEQLVVNLLNVPRDAKSAGASVTARPEWDMSPGSDAVRFQLKLPDGYRVAAAHLIDPFTLDVADAAVEEGKGIAVPPVALWRVLVVDLQVDAAAPTLASLYGPPQTFGVPRKDLKVERIEPVVLDPAKPVAEVAPAYAAIRAKAPPDAKKPAEKDLAALGWDERNHELLAQAKARTPEEVLKEWRGSLPADLALKDQPPKFGDLAPRRDGVMDIFYARGSMDYRVRWPEVFAGLDRLRIHDAPLMGEFHVGIPAWQAGGGYWLAGDFVSRGIPWREMPCYDVLLLSGIPHCALGAENAYAMVDYVKAGGGVLFTGGEYAFGKGGYDFTVLERELLPVLCAKTVDTVYPPVPLAIEPGKDLAELGVKLDLAARPAVWVYNAVALKEDPGVKVFLKSGNVPLLVGRQLGKGRVACLLADHRGQSADGVTAWFDWAGWPDLARAVLAWLAPDAYRRDPVETKRLGADDLARLAAKLRAASVDDVVGRLIDEKETRPQVLAEPGAAVELKPAELTERLATLEEALRGSGPELAALLAEQLAAVPNLPDAMRGRLVDFVRRQPPAGLAAVASRCLKAKEPAIRQNGYELLAIAGAPEFPAVLASSPDAMETDPVTRDRCLALGVAMYPKADLCDDGRKRLAAWNAQEADACAAYTGGKPWSLESPEVPCLDSETLFRRAAWLAYLSRHDPKTYGAQFAREWLMTAEYEDYCARTARSLWSDNMTPAEVKRAKFQGELWDKFAALFARLRGLTQDDAERLLKDHPDLAAAGFKQAAFLREGRECINLLGVQPVADTRPTLESLSGARCPLLADFARARLKGAKSP